MRENFVPKLGFEPQLSSSLAWCSYQLSYRGTHHNSVPVAHLAGELESCGSNPSLGTNFYLNIYHLYVSECTIISILFTQELQSFPNTTGGYRRLSLAAFARLPAVSYWRCFQTLTLLFQFSFQIVGYAHRRTFAKRRR